MLHTTGCVFKTHFVFMLDRQFRQPLDMEGGKKILIDGIALDVGKVFDVITFGMNIVLNVDGKDIGDVVFVATEGLGNNLAVIK